MPASKYQRSWQPTKYVAKCLKIVNPKSKLTVGKTYQVWFYNEFTKPHWIEIQDDAGRFCQYVVGKYFEVKKQ